MPTPEQIEAAAAVLMGRVNAPEQEIYAAAREALSAAEGVKPRVKPLEWEDNGGGYLDARTVVGLYGIQAQSGAPYMFCLNGQYARGVSTTIEETKAAAQADYEARIRSALQEGE